MVSQSVPFNSKREHLDGVIPTDDLALAAERSMAVRHIALPSLGFELSKKSLCDAAGRSSARGGRAQNPHALVQQAHQRLKSVAPDLS